MMRSYHVPVRWPRSGRGRSCASVHRSGVDSTEMRQKCALGRFRAEDQSVGRRSWREGCGAAGFGEKAGGRGYRVFSMDCGGLREAPSDGDLWRFVSAFRAAHTFVLLQILHASLMRHLCYSRWSIASWWRQRRLARRLESRKAGLLETASWRKRLFFCSPVSRHRTASIRHATRASAGP